MGFYHNFDKGYFKHPYCKSTKSDIERKFTIPPLIYKLTAVLKWN